MSDEAGMIPLKRKADAISRLAAACTSTLVSSVTYQEGGDAAAGFPTIKTAPEAETTRITGRGSATGWTTCPLCETQHKKKQQKKFALGRGIAAHLQAVHTPWQQRKHQKQKNRRGIEQDGSKHCKRPRRTDDSMVSAARTTSPVSDTDAQGPTLQEMDAWDAQVMRIVNELEERAAAAATAATTTASSSVGSTAVLGPGVDRTGHKVSTYRSSLPAFLQHAADGNLTSLERMVQAAAVGAGNVADLLTTRDRHGSVAEHWAAGGGHLKCLEFLVRQTREHCVEAIDASQSHGQTDETSAAASAMPKKMRRRDGKTSLHYAARNGHVHCIEYLLREKLYAVDVPSGDGTTPFHLACFGGHFPAARVLLTNGADATASNEWGCNSAHWLAMMPTTAATDAKDFREFCRLLQSLGLPFAQPQKQGHTSVHKAAQRKNRIMIEWLAQSIEAGGAGLSEKDKVLAGKPDVGGHRPSDIWLSVKGDPASAIWMRSELNW